MGAIARDCDCRDLIAGVRDGLMDEELCSFEHEW